MSTDFDAIFSPSTKSLDEIIGLSFNILSESGLSFQNRVWKLQSVQGSPGADSHQSVQFKNVEEVAERTRKWWGRSMEWFSQEVGDVFFRVFSADRERYHVVYNEGRRIHRMRTQDSELQASLISMLLRLSDSLETDICSYRCETTKGFQSPSPGDLREAIRLGGEWDGGIFIVSEALLDPTLKSEIERLSPRIKKTTSGKYILNNFEARSAP